MPLVCKRIGGSTMEGRRIVGLLEENKLTIFLIDPPNGTIRKLTSKKPNPSSLDSWNDQCTRFMNRAARRYKCRADLSSLFDKCYIPKAFGTSWTSMYITARACDLFSRFLTRLIVAAMAALLVGGVYGTSLILTALLYLILVVPCVFWFFASFKQLREEV